MSNAIEIRGLGHRYNGRAIYENLNFSVPEGAVCGLLGKNGQGKTTLVNILMGFLKPFKGKCLVLGEDSHNLPPEVRARIGLLHEGHLAYEFMTIAQTERFYRGFYPRWNPEVFFGLVDRMGLPLNHKVANMSCGQRSQVVLGVIMAQDPDLLILDDYSMGLDAGYRRLFLDVLHDFAARKGKTVFVTSHIVQDLEQLVDTIIFIDQGEIMQVGLEEFLSAFRKYVFNCDDPPEQTQALAQNLAQGLAQDHIIRGIERRGRKVALYSYADIQAVERHLADLGVQARDLSQAPMSLEDGFIGLMGNY